ncbi:MAG: class I SAM-dependent methyltransferase, partial [Gemmataceae bacterium]
MNPSPPPNWLLPRGVNRGLWDYIHDENRARNYDQSLADAALFRIDLDFVREHCPGPATMLDLGCGTGRLLLDLASKGWKGIGVDLSPAMLQVARDKAERSNSKVEFVQGNLADLHFLRDGIADHAACLFSTIGMILGEGVRQDFLRHVFRVLQPGGRFIVHVHNRWWHLWDRSGRGWLLRRMIHRLRGQTDGLDRVMPS